MSRLASGSTSDLMFAGVLSWYLGDLDSSLHSRKTMAFVVFRELAIVRLASLVDNNVSLSRQNNNPTLDTMHRLAPQSLMLVL